MDLRTALSHVLWIGGAPRARHTPPSPLPTGEFRDAVARRRYGAAGPLAETSDPERAGRNLRERDLRLGRHLARSCAELGLRYVEVDGSLDLDAALALVEEHFRPHLPATFNV